MNRSLLQHPLVKRAFGCLAASFVLALMVGKQEGNQDDYGYAFRQAVLKPRIFIFLGIGVLIFLVVTYWPRVKPYLREPGVPTFAVGLISVVAAYTLLHWYDGLNNGKLGDVATAVSKTAGIPIAKAFFGWLHWTALVVVLVAGGAAVIRRLPWLAWATAAFSVVVGILAVVAHHEVAVKAGNAYGQDHSLGAYGCLLAYLVLAVAMATNALTTEQSGRLRMNADMLMSWRAGLPAVAVGILFGLLALLVATWFAPQNNKLHSHLGHLYSVFNHTGVKSLTLQYVQWLAWVLFLVTAVFALAGTLLVRAVLSWIAVALGVVSTVLTLVVLYDFSKVAAQHQVDGADGPWQNLGTGGWLACLAFSLMAAGAFAAAGAARGARDVDTRVDAVSESPAGLSVRSSSLSVRSLLLVGLAFALFLPPTMTLFWQKVLVSEVGVYVLLAVGLNVVVGWAGLLDLGYIAFYAIGSYTTAYLVGSLPHKPPSWLHMSPLLAIPFAIVICLIAGVALGAPTLRLRGDYLAIVTLGFGEIIRITAINNPGNITNSTRGPSPAVTHPVIHIGPLHWVWGLNNLQYWYLLLVITVIVVVLFYRLEGSRLGRAWAAIREDEIAAQANGVNTTQVKLLAFAIGASTSGVAGVFFASQIGFFNPDNFVLNNSILVVAYVVFGGMGSLPGAMAGAAVLTWLPEFLKDQVPADDRQMWIGAVVLAMMIFRPAGLIPARRRRAELNNLGDTPRAETFAVPASEGM